MFSTDQISNIKKCLDRSGLNCSYGLRYTKCFV